MCVLDAKKIIELFNELNRELADAGESATIFVFGGAALILSVNRDRVTQDIDAVFSTPSQVRQAVKKVAAANGLDDDWLNDAGKGYLNPDWLGSGTAVYEGTHLNVEIAHPEQLLAMKVAAAREGRDTQDIKNLAQFLGLATADDVLNVAETELGLLAPHLLQPKSSFLIHSIF